MNFDAIKTAIQKWAVLIVNVETIFQNQNGVIPDLPFCTLYIQPVTLFGHDEATTDQTGQVTYKGHREISCSVQYFGADAMQNAIDLIESLETVSSRDILAADDIVFVDRAGGINDLTEILDTGFEERAGIDILFRVPSIRIESGDVIESTEISSEYENADGSTIIRTQIIDINN